MQQLHILQKIGLIGTAIVLFVNLLFYLLGHFSPYGLTLLMPLSVAILIGYSANISKRNKK